MGNFFKIAAILGFGTFILMMVGFYNGYPLVYSDTGTYLYSGFDQFIPNDRPISYGLFIRFFSLHYSLWLVVVVQNFLTAFVVYEVMKVLKISKTYFVSLYFCILTFLMLFTGVGWYSNQIMPDFFTPLCILIIFLFIMGEEYTICKRTVLCILFLFASTTHFSNLIIGLLLFVVLLFSKYVLKKFLKVQHFQLSPKRLVFVGGVVFFSWLLLPCINYCAERKFILAKASHVFFIAHLDDNGILEKFLKDKCSSAEFKDCRLCAYKDSLPGNLADFIWTGNILENTGGWLGSEDEYNRIIRGTLTHPRYLVLNVYKSFTSGLIQLVNNDIGQGLSAYPKGSAPYGQIHWRFHDELNNYLNSKQNRWNGVNLNLEALNRAQLYFLISSFFAIVLIFSTSLWSKLKSETVLFLIFVLFAIVINSFVTAGLNAPCERFQARVVWLVPFALILLFCKNFRVLRLQLTNAIKKFTSD